MYGINNLNKKQKLIFDDSATPGSGIGGNFNIKTILGKISALGNSTSLY